MLEATIKFTASNPVELAIKVSGGGTNLAEKIGRAKQTVHYWKLRGWFPEDKELIKEISKATGIPVKTLQKP